MTATTRDTMIADAYPLVAIEARRYPTLPPGVSVEDLESLGGEALIDAHANFDPATGSKWRGFARLWLRNKYRDFLRKARRLARRSAPLEIETPDGEFLPRRDVRVADPADQAAARELVLSPRRSPSIRELEQTLPSPAAVADQVSRLRQAMFSAVSAEDIQAVMQSIVVRAKNGSARDAKLLIDLLAPGRSGVTVNQQAIVVQHGDLT